MAASTTRSKPDGPVAESSRLESTTAAIADAADAVKGAAGEAAEKIPDLVSTTRAAFDDANGRIRAGSDEMLTIGTALSFGFAAGLLVGGANRILVGAALIPVAMMGLTLLDRSSGTRSAAAGDFKRTAGL